ncbi:MAG: DUF493 domain-containing protein [Myxococcota bacterium]
MSDDEEKRRFIETLEAVHEFPGPYTFKLIGENAPTLLDGALEILKAELPDAEPEISRRESEKGKHVSVTMTVHVPSADMVHDLYVSFRGLPGMRVLL